MHNNTFTSTVPIETDSLLVQTITRPIQESKTFGDFDTSILNASSQYSIEINRNKVRLALKDYDFETASREIDFLLTNYDVFKVLPSLAPYFRKIFGDNAKLTLELFNENQDWQTLFINISTKSDWKKAEGFVDSFLDNMFALFPSASEKINISINPDDL